MPERPSKKKRPRDANQLAASIVEDVTGEPLSPPETHDTDGKIPAAVALGRLGGLKGGKARAKKLTPERRKDIARKAAQARCGTDRPTV
jgi:hypothetical protein